MGWANFVINLPLITFWKCARYGHTEFRSFWSLKILFWVAFDLRLLFPSSVARLGNLLKFGQLLKPLATINLPKSPTFYGNFCKGVRIYHFSSEIIFRQLFIDIWQFFLVTLNTGYLGWFSLAQMPLWHVKPIKYNSN